MSFVTAEPLIVKAKAAHTATVIFLHGLGDSGRGWAPFLPEMLPPYVKGICPNAPEMPVSLNHGMVMPAWYDLHGLSASAREDTEGIKKAAAYVHSLIDAEIKAGIPSNRILLGGFSMGGALALYSGLTSANKIAGVACLSGFLVLRHEFPAGVAAANKDTPITLFHGRTDYVVPYDFGDASAAAVKAYGLPTEFKSYARMGHEANDAELADVAAFIKKCLP